jgi:PHD finger-like domain-containing protein 5A
VSWIIKRKRTRRHWSVHGPPSLSLRRLFISQLKSLTNLSSSFHFNSKLFSLPQPTPSHDFSPTLAMSRHHPDLVMCRKQPGISIGRLCDKCDGKCPVCDSYVRPTTLVRICDECAFGNYQNKCVVCGGEGISDAFYCFECTRLEKDRDGCPKIINLGSSRTDLFYQKKSFRNQ